jgi:AcrR family transcriptional regulator
VTPARRTGRPRSSAVEGRLHEATLRLVREGGPSAVTVEAVAASSGVAKTTIYRRHSDRTDLLRSAMRSAVSAPEDLPEVPTQERIRRALDQTWAHVAEVLGRGGLAAVVAGTDPEFTGLVRAVMEPYLDELAALVARDRDAGLLRADLDADAVVTLFVGAYLGHLVRYDDVDDAWVASSLDLLWVAMVAPAPPAS